MPTICIDCRYISRRPSGIGEAVAGLIRHLPTLAPDLDLLLLRNPRNIAPLSDAPNVREIDVPHAANGPVTMWALSRFVDLRGVDLFHATFNILPAGLSMPAVTTIHDIMWLMHPDWCNPSVYGRIERRFHQHGIRRALRRSAAIATVSAASRDAIVEHAPQVADRIFVTLSGVSDAFRPKPLAAERIAALGLDPARRFVLTVGQNAPYKNHAGAVRGFARAAAARADIDLVLVQRRGKAGDDLLALASSLGVEGRVHILASVAQDDLVGLYSSAAALLHPSLCEGFGNPLAEAMACGCPVVTSDRSAMPEVTAGAALLVDPHDPASIAAAVGSVLDDPRNAERMRTAGLARAGQLRWQHFAAANLAVYRTALAAGR